MNRDCLQKCRKKNGVICKNGRKQRKKMACDEKQLYVEKKAVSLHFQE